MDSSITDESNKENKDTSQKPIDELETLQCRLTLLENQSKNGTITEEEYNEQYEILRQDIKLYELNQKQRIQRINEIIDAQEKIRIAKEQLAAIETTSIWNYFKDGKFLPQIHIKHIFPYYTDSNYNNYMLITNKIERPFSSITYIDKSKLDDCKYKISRIFYPNWHNWRTNGIHEYCTSLLYDILSAAQLTKIISISTQLEHSVDTSKYSNTACQYNVTCTILLNGMKAGIVLPRSKANIDQNMGEIYDYMMRLRSYEGVSDCFGILTSFDQWYICWLPDTDDYVTSTSMEYDSLHPSVSDTPSSEVPRIMTSALERTLHYSTYSTGPTDEVRLLSYALYTLFNKIVSSSRLGSPEPVLLLNPQRSYIQMTSSGWLWVSRSAIKADQLTLAPPPLNTSSFILLYDMRGGRDGRVWLACDTSGHLAVLKLYATTHSAAAIKIEVKRWHKLGLSSVYFTKLCNKPTIVMPVGFTFPKKTLHTAWLTESEVATGAVSRFASIRQRLSELRPEEALEKCIQTCATHKLIHKDIRWRHVAVFPVLLSSQSRVRGRTSPRRPCSGRTSSRTSAHEPKPDFELIYSFIDLTDMADAKTVEIANEAMRASIREGLGEAE